MSARKAIRYSMNTYLVCEDTVLYPKIKDVVIFYFILFF